MGKKTKDTTGFLFVDPPNGFEPQQHSTNMRDTSEAAFAHIKNSGLLSRMRWAVYEHLFKHGPLTGTELNEQMREFGRGHCHKRLSELKRVGVVREVEKRACSITGRVVYAWDVTSSIPSNDQDENIPERYVIATLGGTSSSDIYYNLVSPRVWNEFDKQLGLKKYYNSIDQALDDCLERVFGQDYERIIDSDDPNEEVKVFFSFADVFSWCMKHRVSIIGGRN